MQKPSRKFSLYVMVFVICLYGPIALLPILSFNEGIYAKFPLRGLTLRWYEEITQRDAAWQALYNSLKVATTVCVISTLMGLLAAKAIVRERLPGRGYILTFVMLPLVVPMIIFGVSLLVLLSSMGIGLSLFTVALGHMIVCIPFAIATLVPRFEGLDKSLEEASADLGEGLFWTFLRVTIPVVFPGILASLVLTFTVSFDEFVMSFFLSGTQTTLPMFIWGQLRFPQAFPSTLALSTLILFISIFLVLVSFRLNRGYAFGNREDIK
ncbi:ABC transporter permease [Albidovulum sp.]|uniref:ABC transporter permease n=1 Tax=Albidovulum sp. TaxID=1872424 RepID=UPI0039B8A06E